MTELRPRQPHRAHVIARGMCFVWDFDEPRNHAFEFPDAYTHEPKQCLVLTLLDANGLLVNALGCIDDPTEADMREYEDDMAAQYLHDVNRLGTHDRELFSIEEAIAS